MNELRQILFSDRPLLITPAGYLQLIAMAVNPPPTAQHPSSITQHPSPITHHPTPITQHPSPLSFFFGDEKTYKDESREALERLRLLICQEENNPINLTDDYGDDELPDNTIAYHRVFGFITADSQWYFSSKQLERDLQEAERNPHITCHLLHVNSPGGEAWYLDRLSETLDQCQKPIVCLAETCCSAAYHIACHAQHLYATTRFDFFGCIGTMTSFYDYEAYFEQLGIKKVEARADQSDLKNKMFDDLVDGKPRQYVEQVLNPLNEAFLAAVRSHREMLAGLDSDAPVLRGETYLTEAAVKIGLCDGQRSLMQVVSECAQLGREYTDAQQLKEKLYHLQ